MNPRSAIAKGKELESWVANRLVISGLDITAVRQIGSGNGLAKGDIKTQLDIHFEVKNQSNFGGKEWFKQMNDENVSHYPECLVWKPSGYSLDETKVIIDWHYFEELLKGNLGTKNIIDAPNLKWPINNLKDAANKVLKLLP